MQSAGKTVQVLTKPLLNWAHTIEEEREIFLPVCTSIDAWLRVVLGIDWDILLQTVAQFLLLL